jgi:selT/selW/selH-like putative selenoprotein
MIIKYLKEGNMADWKMEAEIEYCVPCGYANLAAWMTTELFQAAGTAIAISLKPGTAGAFKVTVDNEVLWDKKEQGKSPDIMEAKDIKAKVISKLKALSEV